MGRRNYLVEGVSGTGKTSVCDELQRRGYHAIHGDRELARHANQAEAETFFCGGSRNYSDFIGLFDGVFVLDVDLDTLNRRLDERMEDEWGGRQSERELIERLHQSGEDTPNGIVIDATAPVARVVDEILGMTAMNRRAFD